MDMDRGAGHLRGARALRLRADGDRRRLRGTRHRLLRGALRERAPAQLLPRRGELRVRRRVRAAQLVALAPRVLERRLPTDATGGRRGGRGRSWEGPELGGAASAR